MAKVFVRGKVENILCHLEYGALAFDSVEDYFVLALRAVRGPGCAHVCFLVPDQRGAKYLPANGLKLFAKKSKRIYITKPVQVGLRFCDTIAIVDKCPGTFFKKFRGIFVSMS